MVGIRFANSKILVVDDNPDLIHLMELTLAAEGYDHVVGTTDPTTVVDLYRAFRPDIVLLDLHMPTKNGLDVMAAIRAAFPLDHVPIVILTGDQTPEVKLRALSGGARDFLTKPLDKAEVRLRVANLLETRHLHQELRRQNELLELKVEARTRDLERARLEILQRLALASEFRDDATGEHTQRVGRLCALMSEELGLDDSHVEAIRAAAPLHDIGKIGIPDDILLKQGELNPHEWEIMKRHTVTGAQMLSNSVSPTLRLGEKLALTHHERWDGMGYQGLAGEEIPLSGRLVAVADAFDAMTHARPYQDARTVEQAIAEIESERNRQFDSMVVDAFLNVHEFAMRIDSRVALHHEVRDGVTKN